jgi:hypothetical protein
MNNNINIEINNHLFKGIGNVFKNNKVNNKKIIRQKIFLQHYVLSACSTEPMSISYLAKLLKTKRQNVFYFTKDLLNKGFLRKIIINSKIVFYATTEQGLKTNRLYDSIYTNNHNKIIPINLIGKYRLHNFTAIVKLKDKQTNKFHTVSPHVQFSNDYAFIHYSTSIITDDVKDIDYIFNERVRPIVQKDINNLLLDFCSYYVDVAELLSVKKIESDFLNNKEFQDRKYWYDCSEGYPERERRVFIKGEFFG